jgi:hypothetical protein
MDLSLTRAHFLKSIDFTIETHYIKDLSHASYSLNMDSLKSAYILHISNESDLELEGHEIKIGLQPFIVYRSAIEPISFQHYTYELLPLTTYIELAIVTKVTNAIGAGAPSIGTYVKFNCSLRNNSETGSQPVPVFQQEFSVASKAYDPTKEYKLRYLGRAYKLKSRLMDNGATKLYAIEDI